MIDVHRDPSRPPWLSVFLPASNYPLPDSRFFMAIIAITTAEDVVENSLLEHGAISACA